MIYYQFLGPYVLLKVPHEYDSDGYITPKQILDETQETMISNICVAQAPFSAWSTCYLVPAEHFAFIKEYDYIVHDRRIFKENNAVVIGLTTSLRETKQSHDVARMEGKLFEIDWRQYDG